MNLDYEIQVLRKLLDDPTISKEQRMLYLKRLEHINQELNHST